jgi:hypothetical protein
MKIQIIEGPNGFIGHRDPRASEVEHFKCHACEGPVFVRWFHEDSPREDKLCGYTCDDKGCWPVALVQNQSPEPELCANCLAGCVRRVAFYLKDGCWLCSFCYDLSFDD